MRLSAKILGQAIIGCALLSLSPLRVLSPTVDDVPAGLKGFKAGRYTIVVKLEKPTRAKEGIEAEVTVPSGISGPVPAIVFIHGNSRDKKYFKRAANFLTTAPVPKKVIVISVQNWWPLSGDHLEATEDTRQATNILVNRLVSAGVIQSNRVYLSGFSAGGWIAMVTFLQSIDHLRDEGYKLKYAASRADLINAAGKTPEEYYYTVENPGKEAGFFPYAGIMSFKGNFYAKYFKPDSLLSEEEQKKHSEFITADKKVVLTVGGEKEAKDVKWEVPACRDFVKRTWGSRLDYHEYGDDVHDITKTDQDHLWALVP